MILVVKSIDTLNTSDRMKCTICSIKSLTTKQEIYYNIIPFQRNLLSFKCASLHFVQKVCALNGSDTIFQLNQLFSNSEAAMMSI